MCVEVHLVSYPLNYQFLHQNQQDIVGLRSGSSTAGISIKKFYPCAFGFGSLMSSINNYCNGKYRIEIYFFNFNIWYLRNELIKFKIICSEVWIFENTVGICHSDYRSTSNYQWQQLCLLSTLYYLLRNDSTEIKKSTNSC